ncbi:MAG: c-type cytochrome [Acidobacteria bacterium]|nr:c-type cytochrome [Acidobacteriota bacterium]
MRSILVTGLVCVMAAVASMSTLDAQAGAQAPLENLQVLPKTMTRPQVTATMRNLAASLGVQCSHCHVGSPADRAKDDKPEKLMARKMLRMTMAINSDLLKDIGTVPADGASRVTCFTCHRGALKVPTAPTAAGGGF